MIFFGRVWHSAELTLSFFMKNAVSRAAFWWSERIHSNKSTTDLHCVTISETEREPNKSRQRHPKIESRRIKTFNGWGWPRPRRCMRERKKRAAENPSPSSSCASAVKFPWEKFERLRLKPLSEWTNCADEHKKTVSVMWWWTRCRPNNDKPSQNQHKMYDRSV